MILIDTILEFGLLIYPNGLDNSVWLIDTLDQSLSDASAYGSHSLTFLTHLKYLSPCSTHGCPANFYKDMGLYVVYQPVMREVK